MTATEQPTRGCSCSNGDSIPCSTDTGECSAGTQTCVGGSWQACTGQLPVAEICDGLDNDCNGAFDNGFDSDTDGYTICGTLAGGGTDANQVDCDDGTVTVHPGAVEQCNGVDDDCDTVTDDGADAACDDSVFCNGTETCSAGSCMAGIAPACDDGVGCTDDVCDMLSDSCVSTVNHGNCDDSVFCDGSESCDVALDCQPGVAPTCSDGVDCTDDSCSVMTDACVQATNNGYCDDGAWCNGAETCDATLDCQVGIPENCDDGVGCTADSCNEGTDSCDYAANDAACDDGQWCNGAEYCDVAMDCQPGTSVVCNDGQACTTDSCNEGSDTCDYTVASGFCGDGCCESGEDSCNCAADCGPSTCGDGVCCASAGEDTCSCGSDCGSVCGDGCCSGGENRRELCIRLRKL